MTDKINTRYFSFPSNFVISIILRENVSFGEREELLLQAYVPGIQIIKMAQGEIVNNPDLIVSYYPSKHKKISHKDNNIFIHDDWSKEIPIYFFHLIYSIGHYTLLKRGYYSIHSACVGKKNRWSLMLGHSGVGKTTILLDLLYNYRFKMFSSNKTVVKFGGNFCLEAVAGTKTITLKNNETPRTSKTTEKMTNFVDRLAYKIPDKYSMSKSKVKIGRIYFIRLNPAVRECSSLNNFESIVALYPFFLDYINSDIILFNGNDLYDGIPTGTEMKKKILSSLKKSLVSIDVYTLNGPLDFISKTIEKHNEKE